MNVKDMTRTELLAARDNAAERVSSIETAIEAVKSELTTRLQPLHTDRQSQASLLGQIEAELSRREAKDAIVPTVSDHALLRFMERVHGVDVQALKADLLTRGLANAIMQGATGMQVDEGTFVIVGSTVTTFLGKDMRPKHKTKKGLVRDAADDLDEGAAA